ncbi:MAG: TIGR03905 family TSCPD domain-containing protein [Alistipes putredinis]
MAKKFTYKTQGTCSKSIEIELEGDIVKSVRFEGGCHGNTQGIGLLTRGMQAADVIARLEGIDCKGRGTSCPDQLAKALASGPRTMKRLRFSKIRGNIRQKMK